MPDDTQTQPTPAQEAPAPEATPAAAPPPEPQNPMAPLTDRIMGARQDQGPQVGGEITQEFLDTMNRSAEQGRASQSRGDKAEARVKEMEAELAAAQKVVPAAQQVPAQPAPARLPNGQFSPQNQAPAPDQAAPPPQIAAPAPVAIAGHNVNEAELAALDAELGAGGKITKVITALAATMTTSFAETSRALNESMAYHNARVTQVAESNLWLGNIVAPIHNERQEAVVAGLVSDAIDASPMATQLGVTPADVANELNTIRAAQPGGNLEAQIVMATQNQTLALANAANVQGKGPETAETVGLGTAVGLSLPTPGSAAPPQEKGFDWDAPADVDPIERMLTGLSKPPQGQG